MVETFSLYYTVAVSAALAAFGVWRLAAFVGRRREKRREAECAECIFRISRVVAADYEPSYDGCIGDFPPAVVAESLAFAADNLGLECIDRLRGIADGYSVYDTLLSHARRSRGFRRARYLAMSAKLPPSKSAAARCERFLNDRNRFVRFHAFMIALASDNGSAIRRLAATERRLTHFDAAEIMTLLRRGVCSVAYTPLLKSGNRNLAMFGMQIVRQFGITDCETALLDIVRGGDDDLRTDAVLLLGSLHGDVAVPAVRGYVRGLPVAVRRSIYRHFAVAGYSSSALAALFRRGERAWFESVLKSYKRSIV